MRKFLLISLFAFGIPTAAQADVCLENLCAVICSSDQAYFVTKTAHAYVNDQGTDAVITIDRGVRASLCPSVSPWSSGTAIQQCLTTVGNNAQHSRIQQPIRILARSTCSFENFSNDPIVKTKPVTGSGTQNTQH